MIPKNTPIGFQFIFSYTLVEYKDSVWQIQEECNLFIFLKGGHCLLVPDFTHSRHCNIDYKT